MTAANLLSSEGTPAGSPIDWAGALVEHDRWLRTVILARLGGERQAVDEVIQEVSLAVVSGRGALVDPSRVAAWLYRVAVRQALLYRRQRGRHHRLLGRYAERVENGASGTAAAADPLVWLLRDERRQLVLRALDRLPRRDVELLLLKYSESWSYRELAERLGSTPSAVESRLHRVRGRLRAELARLDANEVPE